MLTWPVYPAGFRAEATLNLKSPAWSPNNLPLPVITNSMNSLTLSLTNAQQFFRLRQPDFSVQGMAQARHTCRRRA